MDSKTTTNSTPAPNHSEENCLSITSLFPARPRRAADLLHWNSLWLAIFFIGIGIFLFGMPKDLDDYWFMAEFNEDLFSQGIIADETNPNLADIPSFWQKIFNTWQYHWDTDNSRLSNIMVMPFILLPKWCGTLICFLAFVYSVFAIFELSRTDWRKSPLVAVLIFLFTFFIPWRNGISSLDYQFNYLIPSGLALFILTRFFNHEKGCWNFIFLLFIGLIFGWWHEGLSIPFVCGLISTAIMTPSYRNRRTLWLTTAVSAGIIILLVSPGMAMRVENSYKYNLNGNFVHSLALTFFMSLTYIFFLGLLTYEVAFKKKRGLLKSPVIIFMCVSGLASMAFLYLEFYETRVTWWSQYAAAIGILTVLRESSPSSWSCLKRKNIWTAAVLIVCSGIHLLAVDITTLKIRDSLYSAIRTYKQNPHSSVFGKVLSPDKNSAILFNMPNPLFFTTNLLYINIRIQKDGNAHPFFIIPEEIHDITPEKGKSLEGNLNARLYNGRIVVPFSENEAYPPADPGLPKFGYEVDYGSGYKKVSANTSYFISEGDGKPYFYIYIYDNWFNQHFREIKGLKADPKFLYPEG